MLENAFKRLKIDGWRQFQSIDIELHPRLTIITGANGAGKRLF
jgi:predicted ATPase